MSKFALSPLLENALAGAALGETAGAVSGVIKHKKGKLKESSLERGAIGSSLGVPAGALYHVLLGAKKI